MSERGDAAFSPNPAAVQKEENHKKNKKKKKKKTKKQKKTRITVYADG